MKNSDYAQKWTDDQINKLEKRIRRLYSQTSLDIYDEISKFLYNFKKNDAKWQKDLKNEKKTKEEYQFWLKKQVFRGKQWNLQREMIADTLYNTNEMALNLVNEAMPSVFAMNGNWVAYELETSAGVDLGLHLYSLDTVKEILVEDAKILPFKSLDKIKDKRWNFQNIKNEVAKGIIKGEGIDKIAHRLAKEMTNRNFSMLRTHARTMVTSAQNQGRLDRMQRVKESGIEVKKQWLATLDERTRYTHAMLDGQIRELDEDFEIEGYKLREPGDPFAHPSMTYNCRCTMRSILTKYPSTFNTRRDNETGELIEDMTYKEWYKMKGKDLEEKKPKKRGGK